MKKKYWGWITAVITITLTLALVIIVPANQEAITAFAIQHPILAPFIVILLRILAMVIPPIPGGIFSYALIPTFGWLLSYIYAFIGVTIGAVIAFVIARKFREPLIAKFVPLQQLHKWENQLSSRTEFMAFLIIRLTTGPIMDFISYVAGLTRISFKKFLLVTMIAELPSMVGYYLGEEVYQQFAAQDNQYVGVVLLIVIAFAFYFFKDHEFFSKKKRD